MIDDIRCSHVPTPLAPNDLLGCTSRCVKQVTQSPHREGAGQERTKLPWPFDTGEIVISPAPCAWELNIPLDDRQLVELATLTDPA